MCVTQFRDYCRASEFRYRDREVDLEDKTLKVKQGTYHYAGRNYYYVINKRKLEQLAKKGNQYAISALNNK